MSFEEYQGRDVLVTGHTGFIGSWLVTWLSQLGAKVHGMAQAPTTEPSLYKVSSVADLLSSEAFVDVRDRGGVADVVERVNPSLVMHLAAQPLVRESYRAPVETLNTNFMGTVHLLEAARNCRDLRGIQVVTTDKCYHNRGTIYGYREDDPLGGHDPYSASKAAAELAVTSYFACFFEQRDVPVATIRAGNVVGGGDWSADRLLPDIVRAWKADERLLVRHPNATRPWQHVLEPISFMLSLGARQVSKAPHTSGPWNVGPATAETMTVQEVIECAQEILGGLVWEDTSNQQHVHEATLLALDTTKARLLAQWRPELTQRQSIQNACRWYRDFFVQRDFDAKSRCRTEIREFANHSADVLAGEVVN